MEPKSVINQDFDRSGQYESGLKSLVKSLQWAFGLLLVVIIGMLVYFFTGGGYFAVEPQRAVIVVKFGKIQETYTTGGHWLLPYPVNQFIRIQTNQQSMDVNFVAAEMPDGSGSGQSLEPGRDSYLLTGDANIIHTMWTINYQVTNPAKYYETLTMPAKPVDNDRVMPDVVETDANGFTGTRGPQTLVRNLFRQAVIQVTAGRKVDDILYDKQTEYSDEVSRLFSKLLTDADCGMVVESVSLNRVFPPQKTKAAFDEVAAANNTQSSLYSKAQEYQVQTANDALARQAEILAAAETYRKEAVSTIQAESNYFRSINQEYAVSPKTVLMALYNSTLAEVLQAQEENKFILGTGNSGKRVWIKLNPEPKTAQKKDADKTAEEK